MTAKEKGDASAAEGLSEDVIYKIDVPANRYDLLCIEGLVSALRVFLQIDPIPAFNVLPPKERMIVKATSYPLRPFVVCCVLRGVTFTPESYASFIDHQDKLHHNVCRRRTLVAIGTHDLDTVKGPFTYQCSPPSDISFVPLNQHSLMSGAELLQHYKSDTHISPYLHMIENESAWPIIRDSRQTVLSLPPIINGDHSKITLNTRNVLIESTATDKTKALIALNMLIAAFSKYCANPFEVESVEIIYERTGEMETTPKMDHVTMSTTRKYVTTMIKEDLPMETVIKLLGRMGVSASNPSGDGQTLLASVPPTRPDILHPCDLAEDVSVAFGFNNVKRTLPTSLTVGKQLPVNKLGDLLRRELALAGFIEALTLGLCSHDEAYGFLNRPDQGCPVTLANPKTVEFQVVRPSLPPGLLKTLSCNRNNPLPFKLFEVSDVVIMDKDHSVGARNRRHLAAIYGGATAGFEVVHGLLDHLMRMLDVPFNVNLSDVEEAKNVKGEKGYALRPTNADRALFPGRGADVILRLNGSTTSIGSIGVVHPECLQRFDVSCPVSMLEIDMEVFLAPQ